MIRPIDMQMLLPRTESVGTDKQIEHQKILNTNTDAANEVAKEVQHNSEAVIQKDPNEFSEFKYDAKEEGRGTYQNPKKKKNRQMSEKEGESQDSNKAMKDKDESPRVNIQI